jgi:hypothetical protein
MLDCSIQFTFSHEFQHILQLNSTQIKSNYEFNENLDSSDFDIRKHAWEYDADRFASFEVLKYIFIKNRESGNRKDSVLKGMFFLGLSSVFITKLLFYFRVTTLNQSNKTTNRQEFYTKNFSHPHPLVRLFNVIDYYYDNIRTTLPNLNISKQELLNNTLGIVKIFFNSVLPNQAALKEIFKDLNLHLDTINSYNEELYDVAIRDESIKSLLISRGINFEQTD